MIAAWLQQPLFLFLLLVLPLSSSLFNGFCPVLFPEVKKMFSPIWLTSQQTDSWLQPSCDSPQHHPPHQKRINPPYFDANTHRHEVINSELLHKEKESQLLIPSRLMLKIYSSCHVFGSCLFSVGVGNNNVVNFLFFPFELSSCMRNNFLVSAAAGEKCDTDITLPRYDSPEISAYSSNQNSDPLLTSACVAPRRSAEPQSTCVIWSGQ